MPPPPQLLWTARTDKGRVRANNEDAFLALTFDAREVRFLGKEGAGTLHAADYVFAVSDGMGGARSGEFASKIATEKITQLLPRSFQKAASSPLHAPHEVLHELVRRIHAELLHLGRMYEECRGMGTTLTLAWFTPDSMHYAHVGDSRLYFLPHDGAMKQLTEDHTFPGWQLARGQITEAEHRRHPRRNALSAVLGAAQQYLEPQVGTVNFQPGDQFLLCSDGIVDGLWDDKLESLTRQGTAHALVDAALEGGSRDNATALIIRVESADQSATKGAP
jgi:PPM family protein phosphatase